MNQSRLDAEEWFWITKSQAEELVGQEGWPFFTVTLDQFYSISDTLLVKKQIMFYLSIFGVLTPSLGIIFSIFLIGTLWRKTFQEKNTFFGVTMIIAVLDLIFNVLDTIFGICYRQWRVTGFWNKEAMRFILVIRGVAYSMSLASDICALWITVERYTAITRPQFYRNLPSKTKRSILAKALFIAFLLGFCRLHNSIGLQVEPVGDVYLFTISPMANTPVFYWLATFSETIIPIVLVIVTIILSTKFHIAVMKRRRAKQQAKPNAVIFVRQFPGKQSPVQAGSEHQKPIADKDVSQAGIPAAERSMILLTYALEVLLILDNLGYCIMFPADILQGNSLATYGSTYAQMKAYCYAQMFEIYASVILVELECLTRAVNFPVYMALSKPMRNEFRDFVKKVFKV